MDHIEQISKFLTVIQEKADEDDFVSRDEKNIVSALKGFVNQYEVYYDKALEDGIITEEEAEKLEQMRKDMLTGVWLEAMEDGNITDEESDLINLLLELLQQFSVGKK